jgi:2-polyprenyl-6-methoxyphenol hydroxylase-like FAD-dependent oxidoreductase
MADLGRILIVGGGIAGLTLAAALHRQGISAELVERNAAASARGAAITLHANGVRVLRELGLQAAIDQVSTALPYWTFCDDQGRVLSQTNLDQLWGDVGPCRGITRACLHEILLAATPVPRRRQADVIGLEPHHTAVSATFRDGTSNDYDLVIGADGIHSTVRRLAISSAPPRFIGLTAWRSVAPIRLRGVTGLTVLLGDGCFFGLVPVGGTATYGFAGLSSATFNDPRQGRLARFRRRFSHFGEPVATYLNALSTDTDLHAGPVESIELPQWHTGRVLLIGDAAHAAPPHMGQGGSMAMEDANVLAEILATAKDIKTAITTYTARRQPRVAWVHTQSHLAANTWALPPSVRNAALRDRGNQILTDRYQPLVTAP